MKEQELPGRSSWNQAKRVEQDGEVGLRPVLRARRKKVQMKVISETWAGCMGSRAPHNMSVIVVSL